MGERRAGKAMHSGAAGFDSVSRSVAAQPSHGRVLILDDDPNWCQVATAALQEVGYEVVALGTAEEGLDELKKASYAVMVSDRVLPGTERISLLEEVWTASPDTVTVLITADSSKEIAVGAMEAGAWTFLVKPVEPHELVHTVNRAMEVYRQREQASLHRAAEAVLGSHDSAELPTVIADVAIEVMQADFVVLLRLLEDAEVDVWHLSSGPHATFSNLPLRMLKRLGADVAESLEPRALRDDDWDLNALGYPLVHRGECLGVLWVLRNPERDSFSIRDLRRASILASQIALGMDNQALVQSLRSRLDDLERARKRLMANEHVEVMGRMAMVAARQLQPPLDYLRTHLRGAAQLADEDDEADDELLEHLGYAEQGLDRVALIAEDLARMARSRSDVDLDLSVILKQALGMLGGQAEPVTLRTTAEAQVRGNAGALAMAFLALFNNALRASTDDGEILVQTSMRGASVVVKVRDWGDGIPEDHLKKVLEPFFSTWDRPGIGLSLAAGIFERHGGRLRLTRPEGGGTEVSVFLPATDSIAIELGD